LNLFCNLLFVIWDLTHLCYNYICMVGQSQISKAIIFFLTLTLAQMAGSFIYASEPGVASENRFYFINLDQQTAAKGYTASAFNGAIKLAFTAKALNQASGLEIIELNEKIDNPWQLERLSKVYQFELRNKSAYNGAKPLSLEIKFDKQSAYYKQIYFYDKNYAAWRPLACHELTSNNSVRCDIYLPFARLAVFANPEALVMGQASWYKHKGGLFAASPDFPQGSKLRVYNTANNKFVDVIINDFGPDRRLYPGRAIDLDKAAFKKIAPAGAGLINVRLRPIKIMAENNKILDIPETGARLELKITAKSAVVIDEQTGKILWQKDATSTLPLASLTKPAAIKVFLDTRPTLNQAVAYSLKDEEYNYQYASKWESAKLKLQDGDILTIEDLLYAALVGSANNAIETLVRLSGLKRDEFIAKMNQAAAEWGATATHFVEPTGLSPENVSSALDYAIITKEVYAQPIIQKASTRRQYKFTTLNTKKKHIINNTDKLLEVSNLDITGSKTGYLDEAKYCLMARAKNSSGKQVIAVTLGVDNRQDSFDQTEQLLKYALKMIQ